MRIKNIYYNIKIRQRVNNNVIIFLVYLALHDQLRHMGLVRYTTFESKIKINRLDVCSNDFCISCFLT